MFTVSYRNIKVFCIRRHTCRGAVVTNISCKLVLLLLLLFVTLSGCGLIM